MKSNKFKSISVNDMESIHGGWRLFGKETIKSDTVHGSVAGNDYSTDQVTKTYVFGISGSGETTQVVDGTDPSYYEMNS